MCVVSMIMDHYTDKWRPLIPQYPDSITAPWQQEPIVPITVPALTPEQIEEFRQLYEKAKEYDKRNNEPNCELDEKRKALKEIARQLGIEIAFL